MEETVSKYLSSKLHIQVLISCNKNDWFFKMNPINELYFLSTMACT